MTAEVTVLLITAGGRDRLLAASVDSVRAQRGVRCELVLIDNGGGEDVARSLRGRAPDRALRLEERLSYAEAHNRALAGPTAPAVLFLNDDCALDPGFLACALDALESEGVAAVQGRLLRAAGPDPSERSDVIDSAGLRMRRSHRVTIARHGARPGIAGPPEPVFGPDGAAALWRREALDDVALGDEYLDPDLVSYGTDTDLAWRARLAGWRAVYCPAAVAYHVRAYSPTTRALVDPDLRRLQFRNRYLMMAKNETAGTLLRHLPWIAAFEAGALGFALLRERSLLGGYMEAARLLPAALRRRRRTVRRATARALVPALGAMEPAP